ncbi:MAG: 1-phosphofructokinase family hexose kinase [Candidatus Hydrogenedentes bacterium]|nr:1-phosphofructokinase family hexose kinase [Candidatus Hydrogenedentota bacterium]
MIVTVTLNPSVDAASSVPHIQPERKLQCSSPVYEPGGGGIIVARAVQNLGGHPTAVWLKGGPNGDRLHNLLDDKQITHLPVPIAGDVRQDLNVLEESTGRQYRFTMPGPQVTQQEAGQVAAKIAQLTPHYLVLSGTLPPGLPPDFYARIIRDAPSDTRVVVDTSGEPLLHAMRARVFLAKPNLSELRLIAGGAVETDSQIKRAAQAIVREGQAEIVAVSLGSAGALYVEDECTDRIYAPTVSIRSKVGAGDSMVAGLVIKLQEGWPPKQAVRYGVAAGAAAFMTPGAALCSLEDTERLFDQMKIEEELYLARH